MIGIIGKKIGMTSLYDDQGCKKACTVIKAGPCIVTQLKTTTVDGYQAVQLAFEDKKEKNTTKSLMGHFAKAAVTSKRKLVEFHCSDSAVFDQLTLGQAISVVDVLCEGEFVDVTGTAKGKGFQGVVKRHGFSGVGGRSHGQHNRERAPGSIGACSFPSRVFKGMRMAGRMGGHRVKVANLKVMKVFQEKDLVVVCGGVPGAANGYVILEK